MKKRIVYKQTFGVCEQRVKARETYISIIFLFHNELLILNTENKCDDIAAVTIRTMMAHYTLLTTHTWDALTSNFSDGIEMRNDDVAENPPDDGRPNKIESTERKMIPIPPWDEWTNEQNDCFPLLPRHFFYDDVDGPSALLQATTASKQNRMKKYGNICSCCRLSRTFCDSFLLLLFAVRRRFMYKLISFRSGTHRRRVLIKFVLFLDLIFLVLRPFSVSIRSQFCIRSRSATANASALLSFFVLFFHIWHRVTFRLHSVVVCCTEWILLILDFVECSTFDGTYCIIMIVIFVLFHFSFSDGCERAWFPASNTLRILFGFFFQ